MCVLKSNEIVLFTGRDDGNFNIVKQKVF